MIDQAQILRKIAMEKRGLDEFIVENENVPKIITIASGKGGVGKSNLATNLSICLTKLNKKVLILKINSHSAAALTIGIIIGKKKAVRSQRLTR